MKKIAYLIPFLLISLMFFTCRKDGINSANGIVGNWRFINARGGFTGKQVINANGEEIYVFKADSTFTQTRNDTLLSAGSYHVGSLKSIFTSTMAPSLKLSRAAGQSEMLFTVRNDSLTLTDNHVEPYGYLFIRIK